MKTLADRIWSKVDKTSSPVGCWLWTDSISGGSTGGYGKISIEGRKIRAHRAVWELEHGPIPRGFNVLHSCEHLYVPGDVTYRRCVRHLYLGTQQDNANDLRASGRQNFYTQAKITMTIAQEIRASYTGKPGHMVQLARFYNVSLTTISSVLHNKSWLP